MSTSSATEKAQQAASTASDTAQQTASTAADQGKHVAGVAKGEFQQVADQAKEQARGLVDQAMSQVSEQGSSQRDRLVGTLSTFSDELEQMAAQGGGSGLATDLARQVADRARSLSSHLDGREPADLLDDVRGFARRKPGAFLLGALAAGVVAGRLTRGAKAASSSGGTGTANLPATTTPTWTTPGAPPVTGTGLGTGTGGDFGAGVTGDLGDDMTGTPTVSSGPSPIVDGPGTTNPPMPPATHGHRTQDGPAGDSLLDDGPMGTPAAGYGERGDLGERP